MLLKDFQKAITLFLVSWYILEIPFVIEYRIVEALDIKFWAM